MSSPDEARLILVRHGQASLGSDDYDRLSERGHRQAERVAERLSDHLSNGPSLWSGTLLRHHQTLAPLRGEAQVMATEDLNEFSTYGLVRAAVRQAEALDLAVPPRHQLADPVTHLDVLLEWFPQVMAAWQDEALGDAEIGSWPAFRERVLKARSSWESVLQSGRSAIVVTSAGVIATLIAELTGRSLAWQRDLAVSLYNASISELTLGRETWRMVTCNCTLHLEADGLRTLA